MREAHEPRRSRNRSAAPQITFPPALRWTAVLLIGLLTLVLVAVWLINLEIAMPDIRTPRDSDSSEVLPGHAFMTPGTWNIHTVDTDLSGDWVTQEIGESDWLATDQAGSLVRAAFYGTDIYLTARVGPDASQAYVSVNGQPVEHLPRDEDGSFVGLWAGQASDTPILLASNLAHGEHLVEIVAGEDGELAIAGFDVRASTPLPWAFVLAYAGVGGAIFMIVRSLLYLANRESSAVIRPRADRTPSDGDLRE